MAPRNKVYMEYVADGSNKFWMAVADGPVLLVRFGRIGAAGQQKIKRFANAAAAQQALDKVGVDKLIKGYRLKKAPSAARRPAVSRSKRPPNKKRSRRETTPGRRKAVNGPPRARLRAAFAELNRRGIVALHNAGLTMSDGWEDVHAKAFDLRKAGREPRGGAFYHGQDRARAKTGAGLNIAFGAFGRGAAHRRESLVIGREIVGVLKDHGFRASWSGSIDQRIRTGRFEWK